MFIYFLCSCVVRVRARARTTLGNRPAGLSSFYAENYRNLTITTSHKVYLLHSRIYQLLYANCKWVRISDTRVSLIWASLSQTFLVAARRLLSLISCWSVKVLTKRWQLFARGGGIDHWNQLAKRLLKESQSDFFVTLYSGISIKSPERRPSWKANSWTASQ